MRIAIIGSGISGLTAAYLLSGEHEVVVFEAADYIGGHTNTVDVNWDGKSYAVNTGFIVFNAATYPNFIKLMKRLGVSWQPSKMSFSVKCEKTGLEFSPSTLNSLFIQRRNLLRPSFYRMLLDVFRFKRDSEELLQTEDYRLTLEQYLQFKGYSRSFIDHFIIPMGEAIWSADPRQFDRFPARHFAQFFKNHGFLNVRDQPLWLTIRGGSRSYVEPITRPFKHNLRINCPVKFLRRQSDNVEVTAAGGSPERFDAVIVATHSDQALALLADPSDAERSILGAIRYQENRTVLHTDTSILPTRKTAWASWNYHIPKRELGRVAVTYDMNILQSIRAPVEFCVSLNLESSLEPSKIIRKMVYHHPVYCPESLAARRRLKEINGVNRTFFAGAYWGYGFHEDGVNSALEVCRHFGKGLQ
jgi:predicted NAD/FAD-binding protein